MKIKNLIVKEIFDSRGEPTLEVSVRKDDGRVFSAQVPSGKSRGSNEAKVVTFTAAQKALNSKVKKTVFGGKFGSIEEFDRTLKTIDGTKNKSKIGGNLALGLSVAFSRALADDKQKEVWQIIHDEFFSRQKNQNVPPYIFSNLINGGAHANNNLSIQEYLVVLKTGANIEKDVSILISLYRKLETYLQKEFKLKNIPLGDEGGYSLNFKNSFAPIAVLEKLIFKHKLENKFLLGLDAAATNFRDGRGYKYDGVKIGPADLLLKYKHYFLNSKLLYSIEDPFSEKDPEPFRGLKDSLKGKLIVGDDLTTTNPAFIEKYAKFGAINAVIIKPNQIGTVSETCDAIKVSQKRGLKTIVSHRSGETGDNFIIQLAKGASAFGVKIGAPVRERILKFDELIRLYK